MRWAKALALMLAGIVLTAGSAWGGGRGSGGSAIVGGGPVGSGAGLRGGRLSGAGIQGHRGHARPDQGLPGSDRRHGHHRHHHRFPGSTLFFPFGYYGGYVTTEAVSAPPPVFEYPPLPPAPPLVRTIFYSTGLYQLFGDGVTTPFEWVWIPNPPPPPSQEPAPAPPPPPSGPPAPTSADAPEPRPAPSAPSELWTWTDEQGTVYWTDRRDKIPERYRALAHRRG